MNRLCLRPCHASFIRRGSACWPSLDIHAPCARGERGNLLQDVMPWAMASLLQLPPPHILDSQHLINTLPPSRLRVFVPSFLLPHAPSLALPARAIPMPRCVMRGVVGSNGDGHVLGKCVVGCEGSAGHVLFAGRVCSGCQTTALRAVCRAFDSSILLEITVCMCKMPAVARKQTVHW